MATRAGAGAFVAGLALTAAGAIIAGLALTATGAIIAGLALVAEEATVVVLAGVAEGATPGTTLLALVEATTGVLAAVATLSLASAKAFSWALVSSANFFAFSAFAC